MKKNGLKISRAKRYFLRFGNVVGGNGSSAIT